MRRAGTRQASVRAPKPSLDVVLAQLRALGDAMARVELQLAALAMPRRPIAPADEALLEALLPVIRVSFADRAFAVSDLLESARSDEALAAALARAAMTGRKGAAKRLGHAFRRCAGVPISGHHLERIGESRDGAVWSVARDFAPIKPAEPA